MHALTVKITKYVKETATKMTGEIGSNAIIVRDFSTQLSIIDRPSIQKTSKQAADLIITDQMFLMYFLTIINSIHIFLKCT
jgi:hypothetical protein